MPFQDIKIQPAHEVLTRLLVQVEPKSVIRSLQSVLLNREKPALTALIEEGYLDRDYSYSHFLQRGRAFTPASRRTTRIHFFSMRFTKRRLHKLTLKTQKLLQRNYLGFTVVRPGIPQTLGRTYLTPPESINDKVAFFPTTASLEAHICGASLDIEACPYLSQDHIVLACATASLWMASSSLSLKGVGIPNYTTSEITALALSLERPYGPSIGGRGLRIEEMDHAFMAMGYDPILTEYPEPKYLFDSSYVYLESGIPPVLVVDFPQQNVEGGLFKGLHALTIIGHLMDTSYSRGDKLYGNMISSSDFIPALVLHDDQNGMYICANISSVKSEAPYRTKIEIQVGDDTLFGYCKSSLFPLPSRVLLQGDIAASTTVSWLTWAQSQNLLFKNRLVVRTFLINSSKFKQSLTTRGDIASRLSSIYRGSSLPRYIWIVEYGYAHDWINKKIDELKIQGEFIFDPTLPATKTPRFLLMHLPGLVFSQHVDKNDNIDTRVFKIANDTAYSPLVKISRP